ncbi:MAG: von Willebrand factor type A domain-containing protein, partial [Clostridia bacterium]|nr:von Willebrand factor type A domain-containing protein [Clostridia bacterium]
CLVLGGCGGAYNGDGAHGVPRPSYPEIFAPDLAEDGNNYVHDNIVEQDFTSVAQSASSYFSLDRNTASYSQVRTQINDKKKVDASGVRIEEMINYFDYNFPAPEDKAVSVSTYLTSCPWNADSKLMLAGIKTTEMVWEGNANYVFLIDVSGSMTGDNRLTLAKKGLYMLLDQLGEKDVVSVVTYASGVNTVVDGGECSKDGKEIIRNKISGLVASGYTSGGDGLERAYRIAQDHFITGGNNRVIMISDGDFNAGLTEKDGLKEFIQQKAKSGIYLSAIGVGMGNMRDDLMQTLAINGNGNYAYLDNVNEARKVFVDELMGTLFTVAKDAKAGVTFTDAVEKYRLVGYDAKMISEDDFNNDKTDTGEIGSNLCVTALYEIQLAEGADGKIADVEVRYKDVNNQETNESVKSEVTVDTPSSTDLAFITCVAEFGLILRNSAYKGTGTLSSVLARLDGLTSYMANDTYKQEFVTLVTKASESKFYN